LNFRFRIPEVVIGALLATAIWLVAYTVASSPFVNPATNQPVKEGAEQAAGPVTTDKPTWADPNWFIAFFSLCLAVVAVYQYRALKNANAVAKQAADASTASNEIAVTNAQAQLRAYVFVESFNVTEHRGAGVGGQPGPVNIWSVAAVLRNGGSTPTRNCVLSVNGRRFDGDIPANFSFPDSGTEDIFVMGPNGEASTRKIHIPTRDLANPASNFHWYIWGWVEYDDVFDGSRRHRTEFCTRVDLERVPNGGIILGFRSHSCFNGTDGECVRRFNPHDNRYDRLYEAQTE
jgi:hypothetical protein